MNNNDTLDNSPRPGLDHNAGPDGLRAPNTLEPQGGDPKTDAPRERITGSVKTEHRPAREQPRSGLNLVRASDLTPQPVDWLWDGWLAAGKVHILGGAPGTGKTTISLSLAATVTTGGSWPDDSPSPMGNVVIWSGEDDPADTLLPRLILCGADESSVFFATDVVERGQSRPFDPTRDLGTLKQRIAEIGNVRLLIIDPLVSAVTGDGNKNAEVRRDLQPLADLAKELHCALLGITHFSKGTGGRDPVERLTGSLAFGALARVVMVAAKAQARNDDEQPPRIFCRAKSNLGSDGGGFEYEIRDAHLISPQGITSSLVCWREVLSGSAFDLLSSAETPVSKEETGELNQAKQYLSSLLADGVMPSGYVIDLCENAGFTKRTVQRASTELGVVRKKSGLQGPWEWSLPKKAPNLYKDANLSSL